MERIGDAGDADKLYLGDAIHFFLSAKRAGGRSQRTIDEYRKKLDLFQRWMASRLGDDASYIDTGVDSAIEEDPDNTPPAVDAPYMDMGADDIEAYVIHLKERGLSDTSRKSHLAVLKSFFKTVSRRLKVPDPTEDLDEVRFHQRSPKRSYLTKREAEMLLSPIAYATGQAAEDTIVSDGSARGTGRPEAKAEAKADARADARANARAARRRATARALASRDHTAFSVMIYAGLRIEETTALTLDDLSFSRGQEEVRVARGKGNKERIVPMSPKLRKSLRRYLQVREGLIPAGGVPPVHLFLNEKGGRVTENTLRRRLYKWVRARAGVARL